MDSLLTAVPIILITGLVQAAKELLNLPSKYAQLASFLFAILFACLFLWNASVTNTVVGILQYALGAIGLWELSKPAYESLKPQQGMTNPAVRDPSTKENN